MIRLQNVLKMLQDVFATRLEDVLKTSWKRLEDVWTRHIYWSWRRPRRLEDVLKTSSEAVWLIRIYSSSSRRLEDVLKTSFEDRDERRLQDVFKTSSSRRMFSGNIQPVYPLICNGLVKRKHFHLFYKVHTGNEIMPIMWLHRAKNPCRTDTSENKSIIS